jgi:hypothetical protein
MLNMYNYWLINMKTLVLVFIRMTSAFLAESCQGDRTQGQQSVLKTAISTVEIHSVWHDIYVATETCGLLCVTPCACARVTAKERGTYAAMHNKKTIILIWVILLRYERHSENETFSDHSNPIYDVLIKTNSEATPVPHEHIVPCQQSYWSPQAHLSHVSICPFGIITTLSYLHVV